MTHLAISSRLAFVQPTHVEELNRRFRERQTVMPHTIAIDLGVSAAEGLTVIAVLHSEGLAEVHLAIYHACEPDLLAGYWPFGKGFPPRPWHCPICEEDVLSLDEMRFDIECKTKDRIEFT